MAITVTTTKSEMGVPNERSAKGFAFVCGTVNLGAYATNGVAITAANIDPRASTIHEIVFNGCSADGLILMSFDKAAGKVEAYNIANGSEVTNATDLSAAGKTCRFVACVS